MGVTPENDQLYLNRYNEGALKYRSWIKLLVDTYLLSKRSTRAEIEKVVWEYTYLPGAKSTLKYLHDKGYRTALISGSMDVIVNKVATELGIPMVAANNRFIFDRNGRLVKVHTSGDEPQAKLQLLERFCRKLNIKITECACIGDGDNDMLMFKKSRHGITFKNSKIEPSAWKVIDKLSDLKKYFKKQSTL